MQLQNIKIAEVSESKTNPRGIEFVGTEFSELVDSIKEKGILMPILVRQTSKTKLSAAYEVVAGNRRLRAAKEAGLKEIPAQVVEMDDNEVLEAQIVENLQRADVHPLEEGEAYRKLIEESKYEIAAVAAKVGKPESYVKQRLFLTNLEKKPSEAYRSGKINDGIAVLIAKLSAGDQGKALREATDQFQPATISELKKWIGENIYSPLERQPWLGNKEIMEAVGKCQECEPNRMSIFGPVKEGACTDLKCWKRKMDKYIDYMKNTEHRTKVSTEYGQVPKGVKSMNEYVIAAAKGKDRCESTHGAIVAQVADIGKTFDICSNKECKTHQGRNSEYRLSPAEEAKRKEERKKEAKKARKKEESDKLEFQNAIAKVKYPLSQKHLDALFDFAFNRCGFSFQQPAVKLLGAEKVKKEETIGWDTKKKVMRTDYEATLRAWADKNGNTGKMRAIFALLIPHPGNYGNDYFDKAVKKI